MVAAESEKAPYLPEAMESLVSEGGLIINQSETLINE
jgi:hypothetical protein